MYLVVVVFFTKNVILQAFLTSDPFGKSIFFILFFLSIITWYILIQKYFILRTIKMDALCIRRAFQNQQMPLLQSSIEAFSSHHPFIKIYVALKEKTTLILEKNLFLHAKNGRNESPFLSKPDLDFIENHITNVSCQELKKVEKNLFLLSTIASLAPFVGILGTVWGILICLGELQMTSGGPSHQILLPGLSMALATTVLGLIIAIPALVSYNYLKNSLHFFCGDLEDFALLLLSTLEVQYRTPI